jgi:hypothetical protein
MTANSQPTHKLGIGIKTRPVQAAGNFLCSQILLTCDKSHFGTLCGQTIEGVVVESPAGLADDLQSMAG